MKQLILTAILLVSCGLPHSLKANRFLEYLKASHDVIENQIKNNNRSEYFKIIKPQLDELQNKKSNLKQVWSRNYGANRPDFDPKIWMFSGLICFLGAGFFLSSIGVLCHKIKLRKKSIDELVKEDINEKDYPNKYSYDKACKELHQYYCGLKKNSYPELIAFYFFVAIATYFSGRLTINTFNKENQKRNDLLNKINSVNQQIKNLYAAVPN